MNKNDLSWLPGEFPQLLALIVREEIYERNNGVICDDSWRVVLDDVTPRNHAALIEIAKRCPAVVRTPEEGPHAWTIHGPADRMHHFTRVRDVLAAGVKLYREKS